MTKRRNNQWITRPLTIKYAGCYPDNPAILKTDSHHKIFDSGQCDIIPTGPHRYNVIMNPLPGFGLKDKKQPHTIQIKDTNIRAVRIKATNFAKKFVLIDSRKMPRWQERIITASCLESRQKYLKMPCGGELWVDRYYSADEKAYIFVCSYVKDKMAIPMPNDYKSYDEGCAAVLHWYNIGGHKKRAIPTSTIIDHDKMAKSFYNIYMSGWQTRWGGHPRKLPESLSHHEHHVAILMVLLFRDLTMNEIITALLHDMVEGWLGDANAKVKAQYPEFNENYTKFENQIGRDWGFDITKLSPKEHDRFKVADIVAAHMHLILSDQIEEEQKGWYEGGMRDKVVALLGDDEWARLSPIINHLRECVANGKEIK